MIPNKIHHTGIVVRSIEDAFGFYRDAMGMRVLEEAYIEDQDVKAALLDLGNSMIELLEPTDPETGIGRYLDRFGEGLHHVCLEVDDIRAKLAELKSGGVELIDEEPREGFTGDIAFLHPSALHGVLVELVDAASTRDYGS